MMIIFYVQKLGIHTFFNSHWNSKEILVLLEEIQVVNIDPKGIFIDSQVLWPVSTCFGLKMCPATLFGKTAHCIIDLKVSKD